MKSIFNLFKFDLSYLKGDFSGGLTAAIIAVPMGLAFGIQSGLGAQAGLYTAIILAIVASFIGVTQTLISDPTGPMTVVAATVVGTSISNTGNLENAMPLIVATFVLAGLLQIVFGYLKIANYVKYMPYPVISGFMGGIGVIIIVLQLFPLLGQSSPKGIMSVFENLDQGIVNMNYPAFLLGAGTILLIYLLPLVSKRIPAILVALLLGTLTVVLLDLDVPVIGAIPHGLPPFMLGEITTLAFQDLGLIIAPAITLAALGTIDTLLTSVVTDNITKTRHDGSKELKGQGFGNMLTALFGGIPGAGATMGTVTNINSGAKTRLSGMSKGFFLAVIVLSLSGFVKYIPMSVLAGVLVTVGVGIIDIKGLKIIHKVPRSDSFILIVVLLVTVFDNLLDAVAAGMILATFLFMKRMSDSVGKHNTTGAVSDVVNIQVPTELADKIYVKRLEGPLFFGFTDQFKRHSESIPDSFKYIVIDMKKVPFLDESGVLTLEEVIRMFESKGMKVNLVGLEEQIEQQLVRLEVIPHLIQKDDIFKSMSGCLRAIDERYRYQT